MYRDNDCLLCKILLKLVREKESFKLELKDILLI